MGKQCGPSITRFQLVELIEHAAYRQALALAVAACTLCH
jgi:hypothetical protein